MFFHRTPQMKRFTSWQDFKRQRAKWRLASVGLLLVYLTIATAGAFWVYTVTYLGLWIRPGMETVAKSWAGAQGSLIAIGYLWMAGVLIYRLRKGPNWDIHIRLYR